MVCVGPRVPARDAAGYRAGVQEEVRDHEAGGRRGPPPLDTQLPTYGAR